MNTRAFNKITEGLVKATMMLASQASRRASQPSKHPRYLYAKDGTAVHAKHRLSGGLKGQFDTALAEMQQASESGDTEGFDTAFEKLRGLPVRFVPIKRAIFQPRGKDYSNSGRMKEEARAERRSKKLAGRKPILPEAA